VHNDSPNRGKLDSKAIEGIFVGYGQQTKGWIAYIPSKRRLVISRNIEFFEGIQTPQEYKEKIKVEEVKTAPTQQITQGVRMIPPSPTNPGSPLPQLRLALKNRRHHTKDDGSKN
jgi:hypothetical protein